MQGDLINDGAVKEKYPGLHFVNVNLFPGDVWEGETDAYGRGHHPQHAREFLADDIREPFSPAPPHARSRP